MVRIFWSFRSSFFLVVVASTTTSDQTNDEQKYWENDGQEDDCKDLFVWLARSVFLLVEQCVTLLARCARVAFGAVRRTFTAVKPIIDSNCASGDIPAIRSFASFAVGSTEVASSAPVFVAFVALFVR